MRRISLMMVLGLFVLAQGAGVLLAGEREVVRIGVCMSMTGDFGEYGKSYLPGVQLAVEAYNADPGRLYDLELLIRDDESDSMKAAAIVRELADEENVAAIIGSCASDMTLAMRNETAKRGLAMITPSATNSSLGKDNDGVARVLFNDEFQGEALARYTRERLGLTRAAVVMNTRYAYSTSIGEAFAAQFSRNGGSVHRETYSGGAAEVEAFDFRPLLRRVNDSGAETVVVSAYAVDVISIVRQAQELGMKQRFCGGDAWHHEEILLASGNAIEGAYYTSVMDIDSPADQNRRFRELLDNTHYDADATSAQGYDAMLIFLEALKNGSSREAVFEGIYAVKDLPLVTGSITMSRSEGSRAAAAIVEVRKDADGMFVGGIMDMVKP